MKLTITILAALALIAFNRVAAADELGQGLVLKVADQIGNPPVRPRRRHGSAHRYSYSPYPLACEAVMFPRSPLCAGRPATFGPYAPFPWNMYWRY